MGILYPSRLCDMSVALLLSCWYLAMRVLSPPRWCLASQLCFVFGSRFWASHGLDLLCVDVLAGFPAMTRGRSADLSSAELSLRGAFVLRKSSWPSVWW